MATAFKMDEPEARQEDIEQQLSALTNRLSKLALEQVQKKSSVEARWLEDLQAFHGKYDSETEAQLKEANKSRAFVKITRKKTNSWDARIGSLVFPTDDENWGIMPTPVPLLAEASKEAIAMANQALEAANQAQAQKQPEQAAAVAGVAQELLDEAENLRKEMEQAKKACELMQREMADQLVECNYAAQCRRVITDACRIGTGILKGPLASERTRGRWMAIDGEYVYRREQDPAPIYKWVDPWSYFPDMSARVPEEREFEFERHLWTAKDLRKLVRECGFNPNAVRELLRDNRQQRPVTDPSLAYLAQLRALGGSHETVTGRYVGWEYHGALEADEVAIILRALGREQQAIAFEERNDPLEEIKVIVWFCEDKVLKIAPHYPLDSCESLYSIFNFEADEASLFGYGIPHIMNDSQRGLNAGWRMALDNAGLSVGPQIFLDRDAVEPANAVWEITPRKLWYKKKGVGTQQGTVMEQVTIVNNTEEIMMIVEKARQFIDDETALPVISEGETIEGTTNQTATAANIMALGSNVTFRRVIKAFDDGITEPSMRRLYDWNMQHNAREDIKGDMKVDARGSTVLMVKEIQSQMVLNISQNWTAHPVLKHLTKPYEAAVITLRALQIKPDDIMESREQFAENLRREAEAAAQQQDPAVVAAQARLEATQIDSDARIQTALIQREVELIKMATQENLGVAKLQTMLGIKEMDMASQERKFAAEVAVEDRREREARARGEKPNGSGGSISA